MHAKITLFLSPDSKVVLNLWVTTHVSDNTPYQIFTLWLVTVAKLQLWGRNRIVLWLEVPGIKGSQH